MNRIFSLILVLSLCLPAFADEAPTQKTTPEIPASQSADPDNLNPQDVVHGKDVLAGAASFFLWPGIGQHMRHNKGKKVVAHAIFGIVPFFRFWSGYDAFINRQAGYWNGRV